MKAASLSLVVLTLSLLPAWAGDPLTAEEFDAYVTGKTLTYSQYGAPFGTEEYLPNRKVRWQFTEDSCQYGEWYQKEQFICFTYEDQPLDEHCWTFWKEGDRLSALSVNDAPGDELSEVDEAQNGLSCPGPAVGV